MPIRYNQNCAIARALEVVGERWTLVLVKELMGGAKKFQELRDGLEGLSSNVLSARLKTMEEVGIVERRIYSQHPLRAEYVLSDAGRELEKVLVALGLWGIAHLQIPIERVHESCGTPVEVSIRCGHCEEDVSFGETAVRVVGGKVG